MSDFICKFHTQKKKVVHPRKKIFQAHELLALEILTLLLQNPTGDSCEVAVSFILKKLP